MNTVLKLKANGKLLITGEYLVMEGAKALAFPICYGQQMIIKPISANVLIWKSSQYGKTWFSTEYNTEDLKIIKTSDIKTALHLQFILKSAKKLNPEFLNSKQSYAVNINADYNLEWGFGSSSTLIYTIAKWALINEFSLYKMLFSGSAYDLACASCNSPIFYQLVNNNPSVKPTEFGEAIKKHAIFGFLGKKQNSNIEVERFKMLKFKNKNAVKRVTELADEICNASTAAELIKSITEHEQIISEILKKPTLADQKFSNFKGTVKSLGAWGGDFAMFVSEKTLEETKEELKQYGITTVFSYKDLLIKE